MSRRRPSRILRLLAAPVLTLLLVLAGYARDPLRVDTGSRYEPPSVSAPLGTDSLGRDQLARTGAALRLSLLVAIESMAISFFLALVLGGVAGLTAGRWPDVVISWVISLLFTVPFILIVVAVFAVVEPTISRAYLVIGCLAWTAPARLVRTEVLAARSSSFVLAERALGYSECRILVGSILPVSFRPAVLSLLAFLPELIGIEVGLSFFGLGPPPPVPTLGRLIYDGLGEFSTGWWLPLMPAAALLICTFGVWYLADGLSGGRRAA